MTDNEPATAHDHIARYVGRGRGGRGGRRPFLAHERPLFFVHRGGAKLAPENTVAAFAEGLAWGADALELDIQTTSEGELVVIHDPTVDRTTDGAGLVSALSLDELRRLDAGFRFTPDGGATFPFRGRGVLIPTLRDIFERFPYTRVNIDLKQSTLARERRLWELIQAYEAIDRVLVASGDLHAPIVRFRRLSSGRVTTSASAAEIRSFVLAAAAGATRLLRPAYDALQVPEWHRGIRIVSPRCVAAAHRAGLDVHVWTVDASSDMDRLLALGVDGLMTDRPDVLAGVLGRQRSDDGLRGP
jgi:glycerophosphoryl diester phosphodiesterase